MQRSGPIGRYGAGATVIYLSWTQIGVGEIAGIVVPTGSCLSFFRSALGCATSSRNSPCCMINSRFLGRGWLGRLGDVDDFFGYAVLVEFLPVWPPLFSPLLFDWPLWLWLDLGAHVCSRRKLSRGRGGSGPRIGWEVVIWGSGMVGLS